MDRDGDPQSTNSVGSSSPGSWSAGKMSTSTEKLLAVTLMYSYKNGNNVLFLEAGKDFVDILLSFLTLPMGGIVKLLYGGSDLTGLGPDEAIFKLFSSVEKMEDEKFCTSKKSLVDPPEASGFGSTLLQADPEMESPPSASSDCSSVYYSCGMVPHCVCITKKLGRRCPRHGRKMQTLCRFVEGTRDISSSTITSSSKPLETGFVKDVGKFLITDNLEVYPGSKSLALLLKLKVERMSLLSTIDIFIGMDEVQRVNSCSSLLLSG